MSEEKSNSESGLIHIFSGLGIGLLVGIIVGLSVSPVVSVILGALASLLAVFLGLQEGLGTNVGQDEAQFQKVTQRLRVSSLKAGSFGFACVAGILIGLFIRNTEAFSPSMTDRISELTSAGYSEEYARELAAFQKFGIKPTVRNEKGEMMGSAEILFGEQQKGGVTSLFAVENPAEFCYELNPKRYADTQALLEAYGSKGQEGLKNFGKVIEQLNISEAEKATLLNSLWEAICELQ